MSDLTLEMISRRIACLPYFIELLHTGIRIDDSSILEFCSKPCSGSE